ncbi:MAG: iron ABC transporter permease [Bauldia sp.]
MTLTEPADRRLKVARAGWRVSGAGGFVAAALVIALLVLLPVGSLIALAARGSGDLWPHLLANVLPVALRDTTILLLGTGVIVVAVGTGAAWLVTAFDFPGRRILDWALLLPLAVPTYIIAYAYLDILHPIGPVQSGLRAIFGIASPQGLHFPEIRSTAGAVFVFGFVLYPYVYLATRALFLMNAAGLFEAARTLGAGQGGILFRIALPLARPAIAVGTSLALMEALNDVGASEFLGVRTLTVSIYSTWINRSNLPGAAQIALVMLAIVIALVVVERLGRRRQRYATSGRPHRPAPKRLTGANAGVAIFLGVLPVFLGFLVPAFYLLSEALKRISRAGISAEIVAEARNTIVISAAATVVTVVLGLCVAYAARLIRGPAGPALLRTASLGYALPGTVLAVGLLAPIAAFDNLLSDFLGDYFGVAAGLILSGSGIALGYAYVVRFLAISTGGLEAGLEKIPRSLDESARTLGHTPAATLARVHLPLVRPALGAVTLLVFVDCMKELPATLLLRPLNFETLATHLYGEAARGTYEDGAIAALFIVLVGLLPVILLARFSRAANGAVARNGPPL